MINNRNLDRVLCVIAAILLLLFVSTSCSGVSSKDLEFVNGFDEIISSRPLEGRLMQFDAEILKETVIERSTEENNAYTQDQPNNRLSEQSQNSDSGQEYEVAGPIKESIEEDLRKAKLLPCESSELKEAKNSLIEGLELEITAMDHGLGEFLLSNVTVEEQLERLDEMFEMAEEVNNKIEKAKSLVGLSKRENNID